jgi:glycogen synthase
VPIVNATGGLADTVRDVSDTNFPENERNGFVFRYEGGGDWLGKGRNSTW